MNAAQAAKVLGEAPGGAEYEARIEEARKVVREAKIAAHAKVDAERRAQTVARQREVVALLKTAQEALMQLNAEERGRIAHVASEVVYRVGETVMPQPGFFDGLHRALASEERRLAELREEK